jgi:hypothetical protein
LEEIILLDFTLKKKWGKSQVIKKSSMKSKSHHTYQTSVYIRLHQVYELKFLPENVNSQWNIIKYIF